VPIGIVSLGRLTVRLACRWPCAALTSWRMTSHCFRSNIVTVIPRHCASPGSGGVHELQHRALPERIGDHFHPPAPGLTVVFCEG
jgi:hypothetical protein